MKFLLSTICRRKKQDAVFRRRSSEYILENVFLVFFLFPLFFPALVLRLATFARIPNIGICRRRLVALSYGALGACFSHKCSTFFLLARERPAMAASQRAPRGLRSNPKTCVSPRFCVYLMLPPLYLSPCILYSFLHCSPLSRNEPSNPETINFARSYLSLSLFFSRVTFCFFSRSQPFPQKIYEY